MAWIALQSSYVWYAIDNDKLIVRGWAGKLLERPLRDIARVEYGREGLRGILMPRGRGYLQAGLAGVPHVVIHFAGSSSMPVIVSPSDREDFVRRLNQARPPNERTPGWFERNIRHLRLRRTGRAKL